MSDLRDFLYLDTAKLQSFVSQIEGGLINQINETIKKHGGLSADINVGIPGIGGKVGAGRDVENQRQQTLHLTEPAYFNVLYDYLEANKMLENITGAKQEKRDSLREGQFVEIKGIAEPPAVEAWLARVKDLMNFIERNIKLFGQPQGKARNKNSLSKQQMDSFKGMLNFLEDYIKISRKDPEKQHVRIIGQEQTYYVWCGLIPTYATTPLEAVLPAEVSVVGRVEKLLSEDQVYKIVDFANFNQPNNMDKLFEALNTLSPMIGQKDINEKDLQANYPDIFITPIAIFR
jgi:hypothetical protein